MTRRLLAVALLGAVAGGVATPLDAWAIGKRRSNNCGVVAAGAIPAGPDCCGGVVAAPPVTYTTQTVTRYRTEYQTRQVPVTRMVMVPKTESYTYNVSVPVTTTQRRTVTQYQPVTREVPYTYTENQVVTVPETRTVNVCQMVPKTETYTYVENQTVPGTEKRTITENQTVTTTEKRTITENQVVPATEQRTITENQVVTTNEQFTYTENVPVTTMQAQTRCYTVCVPTTVTENVPVTRVVAAPPPQGCCDCGPAGGPVVTAGYSPVAAYPPG